MFNILFILPDKTRGIVTYDGQPALFDTNEDAWNFIVQMMGQPEHPSFMWVRKVANDEPSLAN